MQASAVHGTVTAVTPNSETHSPAWKCQWPSMSAHRYQSYDVVTFCHCNRYSLRSLTYCAQRLLAHAVHICRQAEHHDCQQPHLLASCCCQSPAEAATCFCCRLRIAQHSKLLLQLSCYADLLAWGLLLQSHRQLLLSFMGLQCLKDTHTYKMNEQPLTDVGVWYLILFQRQLVQMCFASTAYSVWFNRHLHKLPTKHTVIVLCCDVRPNNCIVAHYSNKTLSEP